MRRSWDEPADEGGAPDEPVTITERQLRSLKGGARAGMFALILAIAAVGLAGWNMYQGFKQESEQARPVASNASLAQVSMTTPDEAPAASAPAVQPVTTAAQTQASKPAPAATAPAVARAKRSSSSTALPPPPKRKSATTPVTEAFEPASPASTPTPTPMPISIEPAKPVGQDSSGAHH